MTFFIGLVCSRCDRTDSGTPGTISSRCPHCGGVLTASYDFESAKEYLTPSEMKCKPPGIWRYRELLPVSEDDHIVTLGEGGTFLHPCDRLSSKLGLPDLFLKDETINPTGSFLDRGTSIETSIAKSTGVDYLTCTSTGNLAASLVAYAARAGLKSKVFIKYRENVDIGKFYQVLAYGADVQIVKDADKALQDSLRSEYQRHTVKSDSPYFLEGMKTTAYEVCEQMDWSAPDWIIAPMGNGGHITMVWRALVQFLKIGLIDENRTHLIGVQAKGCSPIVSAFESGAKTVSAQGKVSTVAVDIGVPEPSCGDLALEVLRESKGTAVAVSDDAIVDSVKSLARLEGVFAEPASATTIAALELLTNEGKIDPSDKVICMITGMGLKYPEVTHQMVKGKRNLEQILSRVEDRKFTTNIGQTKVRILKILSLGESYGYEVWKRLDEIYGVKLSMPTVYQHLSELTESGLLVRTRSVKEVRTRNYYAITEKGQWVLTQLERLA